MGAHNRKLKYITFLIGGIEQQIQISSWKINNNTADGTTFYTFAPDGAFVEAADADFSIDVVAFADWRSAGFSDYLWAHDGETVPYVLTHLAEFAGETVTWSGEAQIKAPSVGGEVRTTEITETTLKCVDKPVYARI